MFDNLRAEMARKNLTIMDLSRNKKINNSYTSLRNKFSGKTDWKSSEMFTIRDDYFSDKTLEYLFKK